MGGGKGFRLKGSMKWGCPLLTHNCWSMVWVGGSNPGWLTFGGGGGGVKYTLPGLEPASKETGVGCITIGPLLDLS